MMKSKENEGLNFIVKEKNQKIQDALSQLESEMKKQKETEKELNIVKDKLLESFKEERLHNDLKSKFISMISHEYRTPLTVVLNSTYLLEKYIELDNKEKHSESIKRIQMAVNQMTELLEEVMKYSQSEGALNQTIMSSFSLTDTLNEVKTRINSKYNNEVELIYGTNDGFVVKSDKIFLESILYNLIENACKFSYGKPVEILIDYESESLVLKIKDKGIGIPEKDKENIFEPFFKAENAILTKGRGLGLSIANQYALSLKARIEFISDLNKGSVFTLIFAPN